MQSRDRLFRLIRDGGLVCIYLLAFRNASVSAAVAADLVQGAHLTVRDAGRVLGLSHQRIAQLLKARSGDKGRAVARPARASRH